MILIFGNKNQIKDQINEIWAKEKLKKNRI